MVERIELYLRQLAPHQRERRGAILLEESMAEIQRLRSVFVSAHDRLLRGDSDAELLAILEAGWAGIKQCERVKTDLDQRMD